MKVTCSRCKIESDLKFYFYDQMITKHQDFPQDAVEYTAFVRGKAICPFCGLEIQETFEKIVTKTNIIKIATGEEA
jgi:hypothetical protein